MEQKYKVEQIFTKNYARLCAMATAILHDSSLAQDAVQEGWIRLHKAKQLDTSSEEKLEHLILITVRHAAYNIMRKGNPEPIEDSILNSIPDTSPSPHEIVESREVSRKIKNSLRNLSETDRSIIQLQYGQGYEKRTKNHFFDFNIGSNHVNGKSGFCRRAEKSEAIRYRDEFDFDVSE